MDIDQIKEQLTERFKKPQPRINGKDSFYKRRIIFWHDENKEFADKLDEFQIDGVKLVKLEEKNNFEIKKLLCVDDTTSDYLVYDTNSYASLEEDWLLNVKLYSEEYRADLNTILLEEMHLPTTPEFRNRLKIFSKFFGSKERRAKIADISIQIDTPGKLTNAIFAVLSNSPDLKVAKIIKNVLCAGLDNKENKIYKHFVEFGLEKTFWDIAGKFSGYAELEPTIENLAKQIILTAQSKMIPKERLTGLETFISSSHEGYCYDMVSEWLHSDDKDSLYEIARHIESVLSIPARLEKIPVNVLQEAEILPCINEAIAYQLLNEISANQTINSQYIQDIVQKRKAKAWYENTECYFEGLLQAANIQQFKKDYSAGFHNAQAYPMWQAYLSDYYKMDTYYRKYHVAYRKSKETGNHISLDDMFKILTDLVEGIYSTWYLVGLSENWCAVCKDEMAEAGKIKTLDFFQQVNFYENHIRNVGQNVCVIISDALRYEVAAELADQLNKESQNKVSLSAMQSIFPSITPFGMAALLPKKKLSISTKGPSVSVLADGEPTDGLKNRDKILKNANNQNAVALQYEDIIDLTQADVRAKTKGCNVVYIYQDTIDKAGHDNTSEVFGECDKAIIQIKSLIKNIINKMQIYKIFITSDHGFLYTDVPLTEDNKTDKTGLDPNAYPVKNRYVLAPKDVSVDYLLPVKFLNDESEYKGYTPPENIRIKKAGDVSKFVHGGIALQEMVVPLIEYTRIKNGSKDLENHKDQYIAKPVDIMLTSSSRKVSNLLFSLDFYQMQPVDLYHTECTYEVYLRDSIGNPVSDKHKIIADKTSADEQERKTRITFNLKQQSYDNKENYFLVIKREKDSNFVPIETPFQINISLGVDDFDFFA